MALLAPLNRDLPDVRVRPAEPDDAAAILKLTIADFARLGDPFERFTPTSEDIDIVARRIEHDSKDSAAPQRLVAFASGSLQAVIKFGPWKYGDAAPFVRGGVPMAKLMAATSQLDTHHGLFTLVTARQDGNLLYDPAVRKLVDEAGIFDLEAGHMLNISVPDEDVMMQRFLEAHDAHKTNCRATIQVAMGTVAAKVCADLWRHGSIY